MKRLIAILIAVLILASAAVGVSAAYVDMLDHGLYFSDGSDISVGFNIYDSGGAGTYENTVKSWIPMWALDSYETGTTYTMKFSCTVPKDVVLSFSSFNVLRYHAKQERIKSTNKLQGAFGFASYDSATGTVDFTVKFNTDISNLGGFPIYIYLCCPIDSQVYNRMITNSWSTSCEYDPGGSNYLEYLADIRDQLHQGDDKLDSIPSNTDLSNGVSSIDSAESAILSASDPSGSALSDFSDKGKTTVTAINTSYRNTFAFINTLVTKVMDDLDFGILVFLALTLGLVAYVLGRIK